MFNREEFIDFARSLHIVHYGNFTLASGAKSNIKVKWETVTGENRVTIARYVVDFIEHLGLKPDCVYGVPNSATPFAMLAQIEYDKRHNRDSELAIGSKLNVGWRRFPQPPRGATLILEDTTTTGGSVNREIRKIKNWTDARILGAVVLTERGTPHVNTDLYSMSTLEDLV